MRALIDQDYFEAISYAGFTGEKIEKDEDKKNSSGRSNVQVAEEKGDYKYSFTLNMQLRGGNEYEIK